MTKKENRGLRPTAAEIARMRRRGYALPAELAKEYKVAPTTVYGWVAGDRLTSPDKRPVSFKHRGNLWILVVAVAAKLALPAEVAS